MENRGNVEYMTDSTAGDVATPQSFLKRHVAIIERRGYVLLLPERFLIHR
ncbi:MAG: hypothetical protein QOH25_2618 [Acidobacteriota bacterium]|jgi:hypothetical protein|nr:hypothetical protein [Acidobacteriota bacterium]